MSDERKPYPSDVTNDEWIFFLPYLTLMKEDAPQREHPLRELFEGLRWLIRTGNPWRLISHDLPPWHAVYQQTRRWANAGCFERWWRILFVVAALVVDGKGTQRLPVQSLEDEK